MGKQKSSKSTSYSGSSNPAFLPHAKAAIGDINNTFQQYAPTTNDAVTGIGNVSDMVADNYTAGQGAANAGRDYYDDAIGGKYLSSGNPYTNQMVNQMRDGVSNSVNSRAVLGGRYGSDTHYGALARELANGENQLRFNVYNQERGLQHQAAAGAQGANAANAQLALGGYGAQAAAPYAGMSAYAGALGNIFSGGTQSQTTYAPNPIWGAVGAGMGALGSYFGAGGTFSDRRLKRDIKKVGEYENGLGKYQWVYRHDPSNTVCEGVMADEVKDKFPEAYAETPNGFGMVNYGALGIKMKALA